MKTEQEEEVIVPEYEVDLDKIPKKVHRWVDRGLKLTCESGDHPSHAVWKRH